MAVNAEEPNAQWMPLEDPEAPRPLAYAPRLRRLVLSSLLVIGLLGLAVVTFGTSEKTDPDALRVIEYTSLEAEQELEESLATSSQIGEVKSIADFNGLLASSIVKDPETLYKAMTHDQHELLFKDFLNQVGSVAPDVAGKVQESPRRAYSSQGEHSQRFDVFKLNLLKIIQQNAIEYTHTVDTKRARYGITVHADWTKDEFTFNRLNMKATNMTQYDHLFREKAELLKKKAAEEKKMQAIFANASSHVEPLDLAEDATKCELRTGGTCFILPCHANRGATCYEGRCVCLHGACAKGGACVRPGNCAIPTGGSCHILGCNRWRNAECVQGACICAAGKCAQNGKCVAAPAPPPPRDIKCRKSFTGPARSQGTCGDCWAYSTAQQLRYMAFAKTGHDVGAMSPQYLADCMPEVQNERCDDGVKGCCGGLPYRAEQWLAQSGGMPTQADYGPEVSTAHPFTRYACHAGVPKKVVPSPTVKIYTSEMEIANALCDKGPVSIAIAADPLQHYAGGIMNSRGCPANHIDHAVVYTGVNPTYNNGKPVHIIINSWGPAWGVSAETLKHIQGGNNGHVVFAYGENTCNVAAMPIGPEDVRVF